MNVELSLAILSTWLLLPPLAMAGGLGFGLAAVEDGDDRQRPAAQIQGFLTETWRVSLLTYGRIQEPVTQDTYLLAATRRYRLFGSRTWGGEVGLALVQETTRIDRPPDSRLRSLEHSRNAGVSFGLGWQLPPSRSDFILAFDWDTNLFPAGLGGIFLATSRKQSLSVVVGWML